MTKIWGIIGLGWLGSELARRLRKSEIEYWGTTRKEFNWESDDFPAEHCDLLFLNTPPLINISPDEFVNKIKMNPSGRIIFISSIGVYGKVSGIITEKTLPCPTTKNGIWLYEVEKLLLEKFRNQITIIRAGGLIGGLRHPVLSLAKKTSLVPMDGFINLIHRDDLIEIVMLISKLQKSILVINAVAPYHPLKSSYYNSWSQKLNLTPITFSGVEENRVIKSDMLDEIYPEWFFPKLDAL